jgi:glycosyltransferase involved in cell wall biosynthesis
VTQGAAASRSAPDSLVQTAVEISIVILALNEAETLAGCIRQLQTLRDSGIDGEVIVADNGSTDGSVEIAESLGARVVRISEKGYGRALMGASAAFAGATY